MEDNSNIINKSYVNTITNNGTHPSYQQFTECIQQEQICYFNPYTGAKMNYYYDCDGNRIYVGVVGKIFKGVKLVKLILELILGIIGLIIIFMSVNGELDRFTTYIQ